MGTLQATFLHLHINSEEMQPHIIKIIYQAMQVVLCSVVEGTQTLCRALHYTAQPCNKELLQPGEAGR